jgi:hypothetical protein
MQHLRFISGEPHTFGYVALLSFVTPQTPAHPVPGEGAENRLKHLAGVEIGTFLGHPKGF